MATQQYYLKDKKLDIYLGTSTVISGVTKWTYSLEYSGLWAYYRQMQGGTTLEGSAIKVYDSTERVIFVINRLPALREKGRDIGHTKIRFNGRVYDILQVDDFEGYKNDYKITAEYSSTQKYDGMPDE